MEREEEIKIEEKEREEEIEKLMEEERKKRLKKEEEGEIEDVVMIDEESAINIFKRKPLDRYKNYILIGNDLKELTTFKFSPNIPLLKSLKDSTKRWMIFIYPFENPYLSFDVDKPQFF